VDAARTLRREGDEGRHRRRAAPRRPRVRERPPSRALVPRSPRDRRDGRGASMISLEIPKKLAPIVEQARTVANNVSRPISRKDDTLEHAYPKELDLLAAILDGLNEGGAAASANGLSNDAMGHEGDDTAHTKNGANMSAVLGMMELARGDVGLALTIPRQGLGN